MLPAHLDEDTRSDICFFAFLVGNGTLCYSVRDTDEFSYDGWLDHPNALFGQLFAIYLNNYISQHSVDLNRDPITRAAQYLASHAVPHYMFVPPLARGEDAIVAEPATAYQSVILFADALGRGALCPNVVQSTDYYPDLVAGGSFLQQVFAVFTNVLQLDHNQQPLNSAVAQHRAAQYIRNYCDPTFTIMPPFTERELELL